MRNKFCSVLKKFSKITAECFYGEVIILFSKYLAEKSLNISLDASMCTPYHLKDYLHNITTDFGFIGILEERILSKINGNIHTFFIILNKLQITSYNYFFLDICYPKCNSIRYELSKSITKLPKLYKYVFVLWIHIRTEFIKIHFYKFMHSFSLRT